MGGREASRLDRFRSVYLPRIRERFAPCRIILFGSWARGDALRDSDIDILIVSPRFEGVPFLDRAFRVFEEADLTIGADVLCHTPEEFARKREKRGIVQIAAEEGVVLESAI